jgi:TBCC domain-containing protein 1
MSDYVGSNPVGLYGLDSSPSLQANEDTSTNGTLRLTAKPHAFAGAVLSPKHARELTPAHCLQIASALADQSHHKNAVPYTLWITEAWRVLGWAEPSAALFWEMATMYHTLLLAGRSAYETASLNLIPPILSCGSTSSIGSGATNSAHTERSNPASVLGIDKKKFSSAVSAKELPVWLVGTFLLLHCEEFAYQRNLSGEDERRFYGGNVTSSAAASGGGAAAAMDFTSLFKHPLLSPRYVLLV